MTKASPTVLLRGLGFHGLFRSEQMKMEQCTSERAFIHGITSYGRAWILVCMTYGNWWYDGMKVCRYEIGRKVELGNQNSLGICMIDN